MFNIWTFETLMSIVFPRRCRLPCRPILCCKHSKWLLRRPTPDLSITLLVCDAFVCPETGSQVCDLPCHRISCACTKCSIYIHIPIWYSPSYCYFRHFWRGLVEAAIKSAACAASPTAWVLQGSAGQQLVMRMPSRRALPCNFPAARP